MFDEKCKVRLRLFNGAAIAPTETPASEDYWKLIGQNGTVIKSPLEVGIYASFTPEKRLLVQFENDLTLLGLECHNEIENSLWILESDLERVL